MNRVSVDGGATWIEWPDAKVVLRYRDGRCAITVEWPTAEPAESLFPRVGEAIAMVIHAGGEEDWVRYAGRALVERVDIDGSSSVHFTEAPSCEEDRWTRSVSASLEVELDIDTA